MRITRSQQVKVKMKFSKEYMYKSKSVNMCYSSVTYKYIWYVCTNQTTQYFPNCRLDCNNKWCLGSSSHTWNRHIETDGVCTCIQIDIGEGEREIHYHDMKCEECYQ